MRQWLTRLGTLRWQLVGVQVLASLVVIAITSTVAINLYLSQQREIEGQRVLSVARAVASLPTVISGLQDKVTPTEVSKVTNVIAASAKMRYIVVVNMDGVRIAHPDPTLIGKPPSTDHTAIQDGEEFVGTEEGTLGPTYRAKVPVRYQGEIIGSVSVGIPESELAADARDDLSVLILWISIAVILGAFSAALIAQLVWRRVYGQESREIRQLLATQDALMHSVREGMVAVDSTGRITLINDEAARLLGLKEYDVGARLRDVIAPEIGLAIERISGSGQVEVVTLETRALLLSYTRASVRGEDVGSVLVVRDRTEVQEALGSLSTERSMTRRLRDQTHEFTNRMHVLSGLLELGETERARAYIDSLVVTPRHDVSIPEGITDATLVALLRVKGQAASTEEIELVVDPESTFGAGAEDAQVVEILGILLTNAVEATGQGGTVRVSVYEGIGGESTEIIVEDDGPGIPESQQQQVLKRGFSTKGSESADSSEQRGVGLSLVDRIVGERQGQIDIGRSVLGGAKITVWLPPRRVAAKVSAGSDGESSPSGISKGEQAGKVR